MKRFMKRHSQQAYFMLIPSASAIQPQKLPPLAPTWDQKLLLTKFTPNYRLLLSPLMLTLRYRTIKMSIFITAQTTIGQRKVHTTPI